MLQECPKPIIGEINNGDYTLEFVNVTITRGSMLEFPTVQKAKGIIAVSTANECLLATDDMEYAKFDDVTLTAYPLTFLEDKISCGRVYASSADYTFRGYYWY